MSTCCTCTHDQLFWFHARHRLDGSDLSSIWIWTIISGVVGIVYLTIAGIYAEQTGRAIFYALALCFLVWFLVYLWFTRVILYFFGVEKSSQPMNVLKSPDGTGVDEDVSAGTSGMTPPGSNSPEGRGSRGPKPRKGKLTGRPLLLCGRGDKHMMYSAVGTRNL